MGRQGYPAELRRRVLDLMAGGRKVRDIASDLGISDQTVYDWRRQERVDLGIERTQFTSWAFTRRAVDSGLLPSMGSVGDCFDNAMIESFWSRMQVELLSRRRWSTRLELTSAIFESLEIFHSWQRRHSSLGMLTPVEFEARQQPISAARVQVIRLHGSQGGPEPPSDPGRFTMVGNRSSLCKLESARLGWN